MKPKQNGYMCIVTDSSEKYDSEVDCIEQLINMHVEGIALCLSQESVDLAHLERLKESHIPFVLFDRTADVGYPTVSFNDVSAGLDCCYRSLEHGSF